MNVIYKCKNILSIIKNHQVSFELYVFLLTFFLSGFCRIQRIRWLHYNIRIRCQQQRFYDRCPLKYNSIHYVKIKYKYPKWIVQFYQNINYSPLRVQLQWVCHPILRIYCIQLNKINRIIMLNIILILCSLIWWCNRLKDYAIKLLL